MDVLRGLALLTVPLVAAGCDAIVGVDFGSAHLAPDAGGAPPDSGGGGDSGREGGSRDAGAHDSGRDARGNDGRASDAGAADGSGGCPANATPRTNPCIISSTYGVFVAPASEGGSDQEGTGTEISPYASIAMAMGHANGKRIYVCAGMYTEQVAVDPSVDGIQIYGGLECPGAPSVGDGGAEASVPAWTYTGAPAVFAPTATGYVFDVERLVKGAHFEDLDLRAAATSSPSSSSIAVLVNTSMNVSFTHIIAEGGAAGAGAGGGAPPTNACPSSLTGAPNSGATAGTGAKCSCPLFGSSTGGNGKPHLGATTPDEIGSSIPATAMPLGQPGPNGSGIMLPCSAGQQGQNGSDGTGGNPGLSGTLTGIGWSIMPGANGTVADPGQGGGGGGANANAGAGGGAGGCGGNGGLGGGGGGASIAIALVASDATFTAITLTSGAGGVGGTGGDGEAGQGGGSGGTANPPTVFSSCSGGPGGAGGSGGGGGGGAGGPSVGIGWSGTAPTIDGVSVTSGMTLPIPSGYTGPSMVAQGGMGGGGGGHGNQGPQGSVAAVLQL
jgi:hypothetical protein